MSFLLYINSFTLSKEDVLDGSIFPKTLLHELMVFVDEIDRPDIIGLLAGLIFEYRNSLGDKKNSNIPTFDKFNLLICSVYLVDYFEKKYKFYSKKKNKSLVKFFEDKITESKERLAFMRDAFEKSIDSKFKKELILIDSHIEGNVEKLIKNIKKMGTIDSESLDSWFMFKKYQKNNKFKELKKTLNESNGKPKVIVNINKE